MSYYSAQHHMKLYMRGRRSVFSAIVLWIVIVLKPQMHVILHLPYVACYVAYVTWVMYDFCCLHHL